MSKTNSLCCTVVLSLTLSAHAAAQEPLLAAQRSMAHTEQCLQTLVGEATFDTFGDMEGLEEPSVLSTGNAKVYYDRGKYHLRINMAKQLTKFRSIDKDGKVLDEGIHDSRYDEVFVIFDGEVAYSIAFSERINPTGCSGEIHDSFEDANRMSGVAVDDPAHLWRNAGEVDFIVDKSAKKELLLDDVRVQADGSTTIGFPIAKSLSRVEKDLDPKLGFRSNEMRIFNSGIAQAVARRQLFWERVNDELFVTKRIDTNVYDDSKMQITFCYTKFEPNVDIDPRLFTIDSVDIPHGTRFINRRKNNGERFLWKSDDGLSSERQDLSKYLAFDQEHAGIVLATKGRYQKYASIEELPPYLEVRRTQVLEEMAAVCALTEGQLEKLSAAMLLHDSHVLKEARELARQVNDNPRIPQDVMRDFFSATESVNAKLKQGYFAANGIGYKVLTGQLDEESLQLFQNHQQLRFVELMNQRLGLDESQKEILRAFVHKHATEHGALLFEHQAFFEAVLSSDLNNLLDEARANALLQETKYSKSVGDYFRDVPSSTSDK
ncbi:MAG: hypothetical protein IT422_06495 [Pirellulaceae bacterium]|nr:hypothetical protein [Pirellulaceae bacterium]